MLSWNNFTSDYTINYDGYNQNVLVYYEYLKFSTNIRFLNEVCRKNQLAEYMIVAYKKLYIPYPYGYERSILFSQRKSKHNYVSK